MRHYVKSIWPDLPANHSFGPQTEYSEVWFDHRMLTFVGHQESRWNQTKHVNFNSKECYIAKIKSKLQLKIACFQVKSINFSIKNTDVTLQKNPGITKGGIFSFLLHMVFLIFYL
jgi:hypothetical protein